MFKIISKDVIETTDNTEITLSTKQLFAKQGIKIIITPTKSIKLCTTMKTSNEFNHHYLLALLNKIIVFGKEKYGENNFHVSSPSGYLNSFFRHYAAFKCNNLSVDKDSGFLHIEHMILDLLLGYKK